MPLAAKMPETPEELASFIRSVVDQRVVELQQELLGEIHRLGERQARIEGRLEGVERVVEAYREDIKGFQTELRTEMRAFQVQMREEMKGFRAGVLSDNEKFRQEVRADNEKFRQEVNDRFATIDGRLERMEGRLFDMQKAMTAQTRWLLTLLVAAPVIYSLMQKLLGLLP